ncbi:hypothetical protein EJ06DRAFT_549192 [Trichodelitschia bisporula]|uniref:Nucleolar protein 12 n=1 Tax=Trichodelitschia bisporula TaxID=703511 RepID=A0A6G1HXG2_9PEZI|nr:hypothetical protein EJ06DRAFT_549192 [Trichodelitschia bisporula]
MGKKSTKTASMASNAQESFLTFAPATKIDPSLASLFSSSAGPIKPRQIPDPPSPKSVSEEGASDNEDDEVLSELASGQDDTDMEDRDVEDEEFLVPVPIEANASERSRKRKRKQENEGLEVEYLQRLADEEEKDDKKRATERPKRQKVSAVVEEEGSGSDGDSDTANEENTVSDEDFDIPQHESLAPSAESVELEKANRTVFVGNVSTKAVTSKSAKKTLLNHMGLFLASLPAHDPPHKVESLRFRSTPFAAKLPKKAAFARKEVMEETAMSTNAYVVYSTKTAAREAAKQLNGTVVLDRHVRVDEVAHPAKVDHRRCVFVGNLGFVDDESNIQAANEAEGKQKKGKKRTPSDTEEGLWREFGKVGKVESVRVIRDGKTRVGKGIAYVQFTDENAVEAALHLNEKRFPPMLPRKLRVTRAKAIKRKAANNASSQANPSKSRIFNPKVSGELKSMQGRAGKLLGRGAAAQMKKGVLATQLGVKPPETFIFEGHRASNNQGNKGLKLGGKSKSKGGKPKNRSTKRAAAWKASGGKPSK